MSPDKILRTGWEGLVRILNDGGYVRYDFSTATPLLEIMRNLKKDDDGDLNRLHQRATDKKARPQPSGLARFAAPNLGLVQLGEDALKALQRIWSSHTVTGKDF